MDTTVATSTLARVAARHPHLRLLLLHGSRATGTAHEHSDWDLGYLADEGLDVLALLAELSRELRTDDVDLVDLRRASALLRYEAGRDGRAVYEREPGHHAAFVLDATHFWCDAGPVIRRAQAAVLDGLPG